MLALLCMISTATPAQVPSYMDWGRETLASIRRELLIPRTGLYAEEATPGEEPKQPAFNWACGVMLSALNAGARLDSKYKPWLKDYADALQAYWNPEGPVAGFDCLPVPKPKDRYYDDNAWMVLALVETSEVLKDKRYLEQAELAMKFVLSGEDDKLGGGIYWKENEKKSKNTCSNGPSAVAALELFKRTKKPEYLQRAKAIYAWTVKNLRDPSDGLFWDNIDLEGKIERTKWSYNTALMLRAAALLHEITKDQAYLEDLYRSGTAALNKWVDPLTGAIKDGACFAHLLNEAWLLASEKNPGPKTMLWWPAAQASVQYLRNFGRDSLGHYGKEWNQKAPPEPYKKFRLIDQASAARAYFINARIFSGR